MNEDEARRVVENLNRELQKMPWIDFEVMHYRGQELVIMGSLDTSAPHDIEISFKEVFLISLPIEWHTDTSQTILSVGLVTGAEANALNKKYRVEEGNHLFKFAPEDHPGIDCLIAAKRISWRSVKPDS